MLWLLNFNKNYVQYHLEIVWLVVITQEKSSKIIHEELILKSIFYMQYAKHLFFACFDINQ